MTDHHLPDDMARWPANPYELLGVARGVDERGLKRAYAKLIRRFKPEHHPDEFARIRAAYEQLLSNLSAGPNDLLQLEISLDRPLPQGTRKPPLPSPEAKKEAAPPEQPPNAADTSVPETHPSQTRPLDPAHEPALDAEDAFVEHVWIDPQKAAKSAWERAIQGDPTRGYAELLRLVSSPGADDEVYLHLYWLLRLFPSIAPNTPATHWLIVALSRTRWKGALWQLYCSELERHPEQVTGAEHEALLNQAQSVSEFQEGLRVRWRAAVRIDQWQVIQRDIAVAGPQWRDQSDQAWALVLFRAVDLAVWSRNAVAWRIIARCRKELDHPQVNHKGLNYYYDRYDLLMEFLQDSKHGAVEGLTDDLLELLRDIWCEEIAELRPRIQPVLERWVTDPCQALRTLSGLAKHRALAFRLLRDVVYKLDRDLTSLTDPKRQALIYPAVLNFCLAHNAAPYSELVREECLRFCVLNQIGVQELLANCNFWILEMQQGFAADEPLQVVLHGIQAFWSAPVPR